MISMAFVGTRTTPAIRRVVSIDSYGEDEHVGLVTATVMDPFGVEEQVTLTQEDIFAARQPHQAFDAALDWHLDKYADRG